jgi:hypothetical protein
MGTDPKHDNWMAYLYGELSGEENEKFESWLKNNPDALKEINELRRVRGLMSEVEDKEVVDPFFHPGNSAFSVWHISRIINNTIIKPAIGLAAAISLIILTGYFTELNLNTKQGYLAISFGNTIVNRIDSEQIGEIVKQVLTEENVMSKSDMLSLGDGLKTQLIAYYDDQNKKMSAEKNSSSEAGNQALAQIVKQMQKDNLEYLDRYMKISTSNQEKYLQSALRDFSEFLAEQREEDLVRIQYNLATLKESQDIQKMETEEILATIINTVENDNKY